LELRLEKDGSNFKNIYPFILMLLPKIDYKHNREIIITEFKNFIDTNIDIIKEEHKKGNGYKAFCDFCLFFECVVGYFPKK
jgi:CRISPR type III-A-associated protein Csm2